MATAQPLNSQLHVAEIPRKLPNQAPVPIKVGVYGPQGSGKTITVALMAAAISSQFCNKAPVYVVDPDMAWQFPKRRIFAVEGIELIQRPYRSFKQMRDSFAEAEKLGACCWIVDPLTLVWNELLDTFRGNKSFIPIDAWGQIRQVWNEYIQVFLNSGMNCFALGRLGNDFEELEEKQQNGEMKTKLVKVGTKFKAGGGESFGYEPHLLLEMSLERKAKKVRGQEREGEGRMVHRADVLKDRTWMLNGHVLRWSDKASYEKGGYGQVWNSIRPHFTEVQATMAIQSIPGSSAAMVNQSGDSEWSHQQERRTCLSAEIKAHLDLYFGGRGQSEIEMRIAVTDLIFGVKSKEAAEKLPIDKLERGYRILQGFEQMIQPTGLPQKREQVFRTLGDAIIEYDNGSAEMLNLPF